MKKIFSIMMIGFLLVLSACSSDGASGGSGDSESLKIGALYPLSGDLALMGEESFRGAEIAVEEFNKNGGLDGKKVELVKADAPDADAGQAEANRLVNQEGIKAVVGSYSSSISFAASEVTERNGALYFELGAVSDSITDRKYQYVMRTNPTASSFSKVGIDFVKEVVTEKLGKDAKDLKIAIAHEDSTYGTTIAEEAKKFADKEGFNIVTVQGYSSGTNDLSSVILNLKKAEPDVLLAVSYLNDAILLARQSEELGFKVPVLIGNGGGHTMADFSEAVGSLADGVFDVDFPQYDINRESTPGMDKFLELYKEKYGEDPRSGHSLTNYTGMKVVLDLLTEVGEVDPDKIKEAALKYTAEEGTTATGWGVKFNEETGQNELSKPYMHQWIDGKIKTVWPENVSIQEPVFNIE